MAPGVCDDYGDSITFTLGRSPHESTPEEHEAVTWTRDMASFVVLGLGLRLAEEKQGGSAIEESKKWRSEEGR
jgi:hypothetical protein